MFLNHDIFALNAEPENGETGLHLAACKNNEKMITFLLDLGASPNMVDLKGRTPAMRAAEFGHVQALTLLTEADTDLTSKGVMWKRFLLIVNIKFLLWIAVVILDSRNIVIQSIAKSLVSKITREQNYCLINTKYSLRFVGTRFGFNGFIFQHAY